MEKLSSLYFYHTTCNQQCKHCWVQPVTNKTYVMPFDQFKNMLNEAMSEGLSSIKFTGGEPFLLPYIDEAILYCKEKGLTIIIETNGTMIDEKRAKLIKENVSFISISFDSMKKEIYEDFRQLKGSYDRVLKSMSFLKKEDVKFQIIFSLSKYNIDELDEIIEKYKQLGAGSIKFNIIMDIGNANKLKNEDKMLEIVSILDAYRRTKKYNRNDFKIIFDLPCAFLNIEDLKLKGTCGIKNIISLFSDGRISMCGIANTIKILEVGRYPETSIKKAWENGKIFNDIRNNIPDNIQGVCSKCMFKKIDLGGCRANAIYQYGSINAPEPFCQLAYENGLFPVDKLIDKEENNDLHYPKK